jgi:type II secretory pathway component PulL
VTLTGLAQILDGLGTKAGARLLRNWGLRRSVRMASSLFLAQAENNMPCCWHPARHAVCG